MEEGVTEGDKRTVITAPIPTQKSLPMFVNQRILCWFSCGAASAVATKETLDTFGTNNTVVPIYCNTLASEHPDNARFMRECERWFGRDIVKIGNRDFLNGKVDDVFAAKRYMAGIKGAVCTGALKKVPRFQYQLPDDIHVFGLTAEELKRRVDFEILNFELRLLWVLRDRGITKQDCYHRLTKAGIDLPAMYKLGYRNNNCIGCVKATSPGYWSKVREDFPEKFEERARRSRDIGCRLVRVDGKRIFLDEMPTDRAFPYKRENLSCGPECAAGSGEVKSVPSA